MKNELFSIGPITIYGYGLMIAIGVLAAYFSATYRSKKYALDPDKVFYVTVWAVIGGFGGAKLLYLITQLPAILKDPSLLKDARNGFVVYGGIIGGILAAWLYCKVAKLKFMEIFRSGDAVGGTGTGIWKNRVFSGRMLLWKRDEQCISYYFPRFCLCAEQRAVDSDSADLQRAGFSELHLPDVVCRKEKR